MKQRKRKSTKSAPYTEQQRESDREHALERNAPYFQRIATCYPRNEEEALRTVMGYAGRGMNYCADWEGFAKEEEAMFGKRVQNGVTPNIGLLQTNLESRLYNLSISSGSIEGTVRPPNLDELERKMDKTAYGAGAYASVAVTQRPTAERRSNEDR